MNPVVQLRRVQNREWQYNALVFWCPGCEYLYEGEMVGGLHMLPIDGNAPGSKWGFNGNLEAPTLTPSILTAHEFSRRPGLDGAIVVQKFVCHSFLRDGVFEFLGDCTHQYASQNVPIPPLPDWVIKEKS